MKTLNGKTRLAFLAFFGSHIPATLCIDMQAFLGQFVAYPQVLQDILSWYCDLLHDQLMKPPQYDTWFHAIVGGEIIFQLPFFFVACYMLWNSTLTPSTATATDTGIDTPTCESRSTYTAGSGWFKSACIVYGTHTATTLIPILACHIFDNEGATVMQKVGVVSIYLPYLIFPLWLVYIACANENIFGERERQQISTKKKS